MSANVTFNATMLRAVALQIDTAVADNKQLPDYLRKSAQNFTADMRKYVDELEAQHGNIAESANK